MLVHYIGTSVVWYGLIACCPEITFAYTLEIDVDIKALECSTNSYTVLIAGCCISYLYKVAVAVKSGVAGINYIVAVLILELDVTGAVDKVPGLESCLAW